MIFVCGLITFLIGAVLDDRAESDNMQGLGAFLTAVGAVLMFVSICILLARVMP